ncbi:hypothetical protein FRB99_003115 [Tulasnella sp. 403]|nr:hypothetical protein FRB99_003115 [Tulasnella sp. 403]
MLSLVVCYLFLTSLALGGIADAATVLTRRAKECRAWDFCPADGIGSGLLRYYASFDLPTQTVRCSYHWISSTESLECGYTIEERRGINIDYNPNKFILQNSGAHSSQGQVVRENSGLYRHKPTGELRSIKDCPPPEGQGEVTRECYLPWNNPAAFPVTNEQDLQFPGDDVFGNDWQPPSPENDTALKEDPEDCDVGQTNNGHQPGDKKKAGCSVM